MKVESDAFLVTACADSELDSCRVNLAFGSATARRDY
jgi:hypothetical protein